MNLPLLMVMPPISFLMMSSKRYRLLSQDLRRSKTREIARALLYPREVDQQNKGHHRNLFLIIKPPLRRIFRK
jgi:hypothetical protein